MNVKIHSKKIERIEEKFRAFLAATSLSEDRKEHCFHLTKTLSAQIPGQSHLNSEREKACISLKQCGCTAPRAPVEQLTNQLLASAILGHWISTVFMQVEAIGCEFRCNCPVPSLADPISPPGQVPFDSARALSRVSRASSPHYLI